MLEAVGMRPGQIEPRNRRWKKCVTLLERGAESEEKRELASDLDTVMVDSLKALDLIRPIREADISGLGLLLCKLTLNLTQT